MSPNYLLLLFYLVVSYFFIIAFLTFFSLMDQDSSRLVIFWYLSESIFLSNLSSSVSSMGVFCFFSFNSDVSEVSLVVCRYTNAFTIPKRVGTQGIERSWLDAKVTVLEEETRSSSVFTARPSRPLLLANEAEEWTGPICRFSGRC